MKRWTLALALLAGTGGCGDSSGPDAGIPAGLVGEWQADRTCAPPCRFTLTWSENPSASFDALQPPFELAVRMIVGSGGSFRFGTPGSMPPAGQVRVRGSQLVVTDVEGTVDTIDYQLSGTSVELRFRREFRVVSFNPPDTVKDPSRATVVLVKR